MERLRTHNKSRTILSTFFTLLLTGSGTDSVSIRDNDQEPSTNLTSIVGFPTTTGTPPAVDILYDLLNRALNNLLFDESISQVQPSSTVTTAASEVDTQQRTSLVNNTILKLLRPTLPPTSNHTDLMMAPPTRFDSSPEILILDDFTNTSILATENGTGPGDNMGANLTDIVWASMSPTSLLPNATDDTPGPAWQKVCFASPEDYDLIPSVLCSSLFVLGIVFCTFGGRCCRAFAFFLAAVLSGLLAYHALKNLTDFRALLPAEMIAPEIGCILLACLIGLAIGALISLVNILAAIVVGMHFGALIGVAIFSVIFAARPFVPELQGPIPPGTGAIFATVLTLVGAIATVNMPRGCTIFTSSCYGAALSVLCVDYFVEKFAILTWFRDHLNIDTAWSLLFGSLSPGPTGPDDNLTIPTICLGSQILLIVWACLTVLGIIVQACCTCRGMKLFGKEPSYEHVATTPSTMLLTPGSADITSTSRDKGKSVEDLRLEQKHRKYRYLYQVRTAHGDVLSQQYFQNIQNQKKLCFGADHTDTCTFNSDMSSHFLPESRTTTLSVA